MTFRVECPVLACIGSNADPHAWEWQPTLLGPLFLTAVGAGVGVYPGTTSGEGALLQRARLRVHAEPQSPGQTLSHDEQTFLVEFSRRTDLSSHDELTDFPDFPLSSHDELT